MTSERKSPRSRRKYRVTPSWAPAGEGGKGRGHLPTHPLEFEKVASYAAVLQNTLKFSLAPPALAIHNLYLSLQRRKNRKNFRLRCRRAEKMINILYGAPETCQLFHSAKYQCVDRVFTRYLPCFKCNLNLTCTGYSLTSFVISI